MATPVDDVGGEEETGGICWFWVSVSGLLGIGVGYFETYFGSNLRDS
jgi:hypothetical protein